MRSLSSRPSSWWFATVTVLTLLFLASATAVQVLGGEESRVGTGSSLSIALERLLPERRRLAVEDSIPPSCASKCGSFSPCEPVLITTPPVRSLSADYKPQVWRCKCGDELFIP